MLLLVEGLVEMYSFQRRYEIMMDTIAVPLIRIAV